jgi:LacI family transcriptional regulator, galactose operon repressor
VYFPLKTFSSQEFNNWGRMASTIRDVALRSGVSISTVSRVLNNTCAVAEDKRIRVENAARDLGYIPNPNARSLLHKKTGGVGILLPYVTGEFFSEFLTGVDETAKQNDLFLLISASHHMASEWQASVQSVYKRVDGLIVMAPQMTPRQLNLNADAPIVFVNSPVADKDKSSVDVIDFDNKGGVALAVQHLLDEGHRRFAYVRGPRLAFDAKLRLDGFIEAMAAAGLTDFSILEGGYDQEDGIEAAEAILKLSPRPTAVLAANDYCALGLLSGLSSGGVRVPEDCSLIGFDSVPSARYARPALTSVAVPIREVGVRAMQSVVRKIAEPDSTETVSVTLPVELVVRESTGPPSS